MKNPRALRADEPSALITVDRIEGTAVYDDDGTRIGAVHDLLVDSRSGQLRYLLLAPADAVGIGIGSGLVPLPREVLRFDERRDGYRAAIDRRALSDAPKVEPPAPAEWDDPELAARIRSHFGLAAHSDFPSDS